MDTSKSFTGQRLDGTGLYYYGARYYDPTIGRFISADTIVPNPADPQSLNRYSYCVNNPLRYIDPSGHAGEEDVMVTVPGIMGQMSLQTAQSCGFTNYTINVHETWSMQDFSLWDIGFSILGAFVGIEGEPPEQVSISGGISISIGVNCVGTTLGIPFIQITTDIAIGYNNPGVFAIPAAKINVSGPTLWGCNNDMGHVTACETPQTSVSGGKPPITLEQYFPNVIEEYYEGGIAHWYGTQTISVPSGGSASLNVSLSGEYDVIPASWKIDLATGQVSYGKPPWYHIIW